MCVNIPGTTQNLLPKGAREIIKTGAGLKIEMKYQGVLPT